MVVEYRAANGRGEISLASRSHGFAVLVPLLATVVAGFGAHAPARGQEPIAEFAIIVGPVGEQLTFFNPFD